MATAVTASWPVASFANVKSFLGASRYSNDECVVLTDEQTITIYKVSDQQNISSLSLKSDSKFKLPVVYDYEEEKLVAVVEQLGKKKLCSWTENLTDYKDWKKKLLLAPITALVEVKGCEPLVVKPDMTVCWLSQYEDTSFAVSLVPEALKGTSLNICKFKAYRYGTKTELIYHTSSQGLNQVCCLQFNAKQITGQPSVLLDQMSVVAICRCPSLTESTYIAATEDHRLLLVHIGDTTPQLVHTFSAELTIMGLTFLRDSDQLLLSANEMSHHNGKLMVFSLKFRKLRMVKTLSCRLVDSNPLLHLHSHLLTLSEDGVHAHSYLFAKLTLRGMIGAIDISDESQSEGGAVSNHMDELESQAKQPEALAELIDKLDRKLLLDVLSEYCKTEGGKWETSVIQALLEKLILPSHLLTQVAEAATQQSDMKIVEYLTFSVAELPEAAVAILVSFLLKNVSEQGETMDTDEGDAMPLIPSHIVPTINTLLSKELTDVYASEAMRKIEFDRVLILLQYLADLLSAECEDRSCLLTDEQICRWCAVVLDAHYTQIILSRHGELLVKLHENVRLHVELQSHILKLGANLACKPPVRGPTTGPYSIEAVTFHY